MDGIKKKRLPVGIDSFEKIRSLGFYYVDKTAMIRDLLSGWGEVNLFTRPRRFGKSLNMSMLKSFFEIGSDQSLFDGLEISKESALCDEYMGQFPVISISLKGVDGFDFTAARSCLCSAIGNEAMRYQFLAEDEKFSTIEKELFRQLVTVDKIGAGRFYMPDSVLVESLRTLSMLLEKHYNKKVIILIDEYDVPLAKANEHGYYDEMVLLLRNLFQQTLKTNDSLYFAVMTGCLRVARESIFTGLNNLKILSITSVRFDEYFGFTDREIKELLKCYQLENKYEAIRNWYDGYRFGNEDVYCPWDVISYCDELLDDSRTDPKNYWSNTSGNEAVQHFIQKMGNGVMKSEVEALIAGETIEKEVHEDLTYQGLYQSAENIWSLLLMTGYLTQRGKTDENHCQLAIPNMEIRAIFTRQIMAMFKADVAKDGQLLKRFCDALQTGDAAEVETLFVSYLDKTISIRDSFVRKPTKENFYHGILLGILGYKNDWYLKSNKESGNGYSDIFIKIEDKGIGIIIEIKYAEGRQFDLVCRNAIAQIQEHNYGSELRKAGCHIIYKYGIACYQKECRVIVEKETDL